MDFDDIKDKFWTLVVGIVLCIIGVSICINRIAIYVWGIITVWKMGLWSFYDALCGWWCGVWTVVVLGLILIIAGIGTGFSIFSKE